MDMGSRLYKLALWYIKKCNAIQRLGEYENIADIAEQLKG